MMNNENGRSMVEMLGVLAIIGVLSVAGIAGYSMAMKKYRANEITNVASQMVVLAQTANAGIGITSGAYVSAGSVGMSSDAYTSSYMGTPNVKYDGNKTYTVQFKDSDACTTAQAAVSGNGIIAIACDGS